MSVVAAAVAKYAAMSFPTGVTKPPLSFDGIPQTNSAGVFLALPYVNLVDEGTTVDENTVSGFDFEGNPVEVTVLRFEVYTSNDPSLRDAVMKGIKYANGAFNAKLGFDFGMLTIVEQLLMECRRTHEKRSMATQLQEAAKYVHKGEIWYGVQAQVTGP